jgi:hypothetical protein
VSVKDAAGLTIEVFFIVLQIVDGKAIPLQALTGPEGSRRLRLQDFKVIDT